MGDYGGSYDRGDYYGYGRGQGDYYDYGRGRYGQSGYDRDYGRRGYGMGDYGGSYDRGDYYGYGRGRSWQGGYGRDYDRGRFGSQSYGGSYGEGFWNYPENWRGRYTGRGPRSYRRSDERIKEDVNERLTQHGDIDASDIEVDINQGVVTLRGNVDDRRAKRMAEDVAESVFGVREVQNQLRVRQHEGLLERIGNALS
jgi:osmotically-inducible protein OsmY